MRVTVDLHLQYDAAHRMFTTNGNLHVNLRNSEAHPDCNRTPVLILSPQLGVQSVGLHVQDDNIQDPDGSARVRVLPVVPFKLQQAPVPLPSFCDDLETQMGGAEMRGPRDAARDFLSDEGGDIHDKESDDSTGSAFNLVFGSCSSAGDDTHDHAGIGGLVKSVTMEQPVELAGVPSISTSAPRVLKLRRSSPQNEEDLASAVEQVDRCADRNDYKGHSQHIPPCGEDEVAGFLPYLLSFPICETAEESLVGPNEVIVQYDIEFVSCGVSPWLSSMWASPDGAASPVSYSLLLSCPQRSGILCPRVSCTCDPGPDTTPRYSVPVDAVVCSVKVEPSAFRIYVFNNLCHMPTVAELCLAVASVALPTPRSALPFFVKEQCAISNLTRIGKRWWNVVGHERVTEATLHNGEHGPSTARWVYTFLCCDFRCVDQLHSFLLRVWRHTMPTLNSLGYDAFGLQVVVTQYTNEVLAARRGAAGERGIVLLSADLVAQICSSAGELAEPSIASARAAVAASAAVIEQHLLFCMLGPATTSKSVWLTAATIARAAGFTCYLRGYWRDSILALLAEERIITIAVILYGRLARDAWRRPQPHRDALLERYAALSMNALWLVTHPVLLEWLACGCANVLSELVCLLSSGSLVLSAKIGKVDDPTDKGKAQCSGQGAALPSSGTGPPPLFYSYVSCEVSFPCVPARFFNIRLAWRNLSFLLSGAGSARATQEGLGHLPGGGQGHGMPSKERVTVSFVFLVFVFTSDDATTADETGEARVDGASRVRLSQATPFNIDISSSACIRGGEHRTHISILRTGEREKVSTRRTANRSKIGDDKKERTVQPMNDKFHRGKRRRMFNEPDAEGDACGDGRTMKGKVNSFREITLPLVVFNSSAGSSLVEVEMPYLNILRQCLLACNPDCEAASDKTSQGPLVDCRSCKALIAALVRYLIGHIVFHTVRHACKDGHCRPCTTTEQKSHLLEDQEVLWCYRTLLNGLLQDSFMKTTSCSDVVQSPIKTGAFNSLSFHDHYVEVNESNLSLCGNAFLMNIMEPATIVESVCAIVRQQEHMGESSTAFISSYVKSLSPLAAQWMERSPYPEAIAIYHILLEYILWWPVSQCLRQWLFCHGFISLCDDVSIAMPDGIRAHPCTGHIMSAFCGTKATKRFPCTEFSSGGEKVEASPVWPRGRNGDLVTDYNRATDFSSTSLDCSGIRGKSDLTETRRTCCLETMWQVRAQAVEESSFSTQGGHGGRSNAEFIPTSILPLVQFLLAHGTASVPPPLSTHLGTLKEM